MKSIDNNANQQAGKNKTTASIRPPNSNTHASNSTYEVRIMNKNPNENFTLVTMLQKLKEFTLPHLKPHCQAIRGAIQRAI